MKWTGEKESRDLLRKRFEAQTDIEIDRYPTFDDWRQYAEWLERLSIQKLNNELARENEVLREKMQKAMNILERGISGAYAKRKIVRSGRRE